MLFVCLFALVASANGWAFPSKKAAQLIGRKAFLGGVAGGVVVVGTAGAAWAANERINNRPTPYEPSAGSMDGKVVLITGGSTGLGLESAKRLGAAGATIVLTSRNLSKGAKAVDDVKAYLADKGTTNEKIYNLVLDLDDLENVKAFPKAYEELGLGKISVLLNNAGVMAIPDKQLTKDGYERTFQSNHLGHFVLTAGLFPFLSREKSTVINVSSLAYNIAGSKGLELNNLNGEQSYGAWTSYGQSKLSNILFTQELQRRADSAGDSWLTTVTLHPGAVATDLGRYLVGEEKWNDLKTKGPSGLEMLALQAASLFTKTVPEGASTQVFLASGAEGTLKKAAFYDDLKVQSLPAYAKDEAKAKELWEKSEELGGIQFVLGDTVTSSATTVDVASSDSV